MCLRMRKWCRLGLFLKFLIVVLTFPFAKAISASKDECRWYEYEPLRNVWNQKIPNTKNFIVANSDGEDPSGGRCELIYLNCSRLNFAWKTNDKGEPIAEEFDAYVHKTDSNFSSSIRFADFLKKKQAANSIKSAEDYSPEIPLYLDAAMTCYEKLGLTLPPLIANHYHRISAPFGGIVSTKNSSGVENRPKYTKYIFSKVIPDLIGKGIGYAAAKKLGFPRSSSNTIPTLESEDIENERVGDENATDSKAEDSDSANPQ